MVIEEIKQILAKQLRIEVTTIEDDSNIIEDLGADSIDLVEMLMVIEENMDVVIPDEEAVKLKTVRNVADFIEQNT
ncbi:acyl carrier protein [Eubacteriales bacterium OttesenSCG-928-G02]|nr:acyl carrier protein [Eubacteriales bacterium OttesenSCG-928-G02]